MRISRLELFGFKSFPDRTSLHFGGGISCVVGPNGSGKSNVVDALKWVIGEQSARSLRGADMTDVIFAGSTDRKPVGFAEVSLTLEVAEGEPFPGEYAQLKELQVGRRLHRNGSSEYLINQVKCRRRDVVDLFLDTGIGTNLYSFIEQGRVDKVVSATPTERRGLIDEAAGISRYKARREEARGRLEATVQQLDRAADVVDEMARRLHVLERQVVKAARFRQIRARVRQREIYLALVKYQALSADRRALQAGLRDARSEEAAARRALQRREEDLRARREELDSVEEALATWRDEVAEHDARLRELASQATLQRERARELMGEASRAEAEQARCVEALAELETQRATLTREREEAEAALTSMRASAEERREAAEQAKMGSRALASEVEGLEARFTHALTERTALEAEVATWRARGGEAMERAERLATEGASLAGQLAAEVAAFDGLVQACAAADDGVAAARSALRVAEEALRSVEEERGRREGARREQRAEAVRALGEARSAQQRAQADARATVAQVRAASSSASAEARREREQEVGRRRARADEWAEGIAKEAAGRIARARAALDGLARTLDERAAQAEHVARREADREAVEAERALEERIAGGLGPARNEVAKARRAEQSAREEEAAARSERMEAEATLAALQASATLHERPPALAGARPVVDRLPPGEAADAALRLGRRAVLPALETVDELLAASVALSGQGAMVWWWRGEWPPQPAQAESLEDALRLHDRQGGAVTSPDGRIDADGVVSLGRHDPALERVRWRDAVSSAEGAVAACTERAEHATTRAVEARRRLDDAEVALIEVGREADEARRAGRREAARTVAERVAVAVELAREERAAELEAARAAVAAAEREGEAWRQRAQRERLTALAATAAEVDARLEARLADIDASSARAEAEAAGPVAVCTQRLEAALAAVEALDAHPMDLPDRGPAAGEQEVARSRLASAERERADLARRMAVAEERGRALRLRVEERRIDEARAREEASAAEGRVSACVEQVARAREAEGEAHRVLLDARARAADAAEVEAAASRLAATVSADCRAWEERRTGLTARLEELARRRASLLEQGERAAAHGAALNERRREAEGSAAGATEQAAVATEQRAAAWDRLERERARAAELRSGLHEAERDLVTLGKRMDAALAAVQERTDRSAAVRSELEGLRERMDERYQVGLPALVDRLERAGQLALEADPEVAAGLEIAGQQVPGVPPLVIRVPMLEDEERIVQAVSDLEGDRTELAGLGEVHLGALEEYLDLHARHGELVAQREDLEGSVERLRTAIASMNRTCRERFREAFDRVNESFQESYPKLVGGGAARLALTDDEDLLETGVEIFVQPPGKRLQHLQLLSGGEKAMTAIALLIALFTVKPSPFCVLDEVDAPLDERNGGRFNNMLRELAERSQFVVITHNRKTMECADTLYGISMTRPGVSTVLSVSLQ